MPIIQPYAHPPPCGRLGSPAHGSDKPINLKTKGGEFMRKHSFKPTPIPKRTKSGEPMAYYILSEDGKQENKVTRAACLARTDELGIELPQRWYVDEEAGLVVRLPRNQMGEDLARENMRFIWREEKRNERNCSCVLKGTDKCQDWKPDADGFVKCDCCQRPNRSRTVELDMHFRSENDGDEDSPEARFEPADPIDIQTVIEDQALLDTLYAALATLAKEDLDLIKDVFWKGKTERELAPLLGLKEPKSVNKRKHRVLEILRNNTALKGFFE